MVAFIPGVMPRRGDADHPRHTDDLLRLISLVVSLKLRLLGNGFKGSNARMIAGLIGSAAGLGATITGVYLVVQLRRAEPADAHLLLVFVGSLVVLGWLLLPVLIFGVDESVDPQRFSLLPVPRRRLLAALFAAGFTGIPAAATLIVSLTTVVTWWRGVVPVFFALTAALLATSLCVVASRTITTTLAEILRSRRVRDVVSVSGMLLIGTVALLQLGLPSMAHIATRDVLERIAAVVAWTPLGAAWAAPYDAATGSVALGAARLLVVAGSIVVMLGAWDIALRRSLEGGGVSAAHSSRRGGPHRGRRDALTPSWARWLLPGTITGAVAARVLHLWWRDPRQRVSMLIVPVILLGLVVAPSVAGLRDEVLILTAPGIGTLIGLMMLNHTAYDGTALWTHLAVALPGRVDRAGRALGTAAWTVPVVALASVMVCLLIDRADLLPAALGSAVATVLVGLAFASVTSVVIAFPAPPPGANPFVTPSGGNVAVVLQQFAGGLAVALLSLPVYIFLGMALWWRPGLGWVLLVGGPAYGLLLLRAGNRVGGRYLDDRGPELLRRITPSRT